MIGTVAIIGTGNVGRGLGASLSEAGLEVVYGTRGAFEGELGAKEEATDVAEAIERGEIVLLAIPGGAVEGFAREHAAALAGKVVVDATNPIRWEGGPVWSPPQQGSNAALLADLTGAKVVKGFNGFGAEFHRAPGAVSEGVEVFLAGDDSDAVAAVREVAERAGFRATAAGPLRNAAVLENAAILWIHLAMVEGMGRGFVLQRVSRDEG